LLVFKLLPLSLPTLSLTSDALVVINALALLVLLAPRLRLRLKY
jgi:hypothetical protein